GCLAGLYFVTQPLSRYLAKKIPFEYELKLASQMKYNELFHVCRANKGPEKNEYQFIVKIKQLYPDTVEVLRDLKKIKVIKMDQSNAFALPGGYIFITDKFINEAKTYEEIVGVIAHEQGHFFNRHHLQAMIRGSLLTMSASLTTGDVTSFMLMDPSTLMSIVSLKFNREDEDEADRFAAEQILKKMHLSTGGLIDFFDRSSKDVDVINHKVPDFLLTHPADVARIQMLKKYLTETPLNEIDPDDQINVLCD
ncbi:MAG: M48 family metallopeptidase, partial [Bdellovibrionaceae bacterium]|nr:M48 family metallopeptidase [Pseudobdellovibrionaceae bacterium]